MNKKYNKRVYPYVKVKITLENQLLKYIFKLIQGSIINSKHACIEVRYRKMFSVYADKKCNT